MNRLYFALVLVIVMCFNMSILLIQKQKEKECPIDSPMYEGLAECITALQTNVIETFVNSPAVARILLRSMKSHCDHEMALNETVTDHPAIKGTYTRTFHHSQDD